MKCKHCGSSKVVKAGIQYQKGCSKQRYECRDCKRITIGEVVQNSVIVIEETDEYQHSIPRSVIK